MTRCGRRLRASRTGIGSVRGLAIGAPLDGADVAAGTSVCEGVDNTPANHTTDCTGSVSWLFSTDVAAEVDGIVRPACLTRGLAPGARFGSAVRGLGPSAGNAALARIAVGAPDVPANAGGVFIADVDAACNVDVDVASALRGVPGERFGATLDTVTRHFTIDLTDVPAEVHEHPTSLRTAT